MPGKKKESQKDPKKKTTNIVLKEMPETTKGTKIKHMTTSTSVLIMEK